VSEPAGPPLDEPSDVPLDVGAVLDRVEDRQTAAATAQMHVRQQRLAAAEKRLHRQSVAETQAIEAEKEELRRREETLRGLHAEVSAAQQTLLEQRVAAEQLWATLSDRLPPAQLARGLQMARRQLEEQYRRVRQELAHRQGEIDQACQQLRLDCARLDEARQEHEDWLAGRREELAAEVRRITTRRMELEQREVALESLEARWHDERIELLEQLRLAAAGSRAKIPHPTPSG